MSFRFGIRTGFPFVNKGVIVVRTTETQFQRALEAFNAFRAALYALGMQDVADRLVFERR